MTLSEILTNNAVYSFGSLLVLTIASFWRMNSQLTRVSTQVDAISDALPPMRAKLDNVSERLARLEGMLQRDTRDSTPPSL